jgi:gluconate 2-dehydrogenase gamma chain
MRRRHFLTLSVSSLGGLLVYSLDRQPSVIQAQTSQTVRIPLRFFTEREALVIAAAAARIFPSDASGPGANEAGVVVFIDRQLASRFGTDRYRYTKPPFEEGLPEQGYQGKQTPRDTYREGLGLLGDDFASLDAKAQDEKLREIEKTRFFRMLREHTIQGMFCDPMHGGNANLVGWQLIGYPGPYMSWANDVGGHRGEAFRPKPMSLGDVTGHAVMPWEEEAE